MVVCRSSLRHPLAGVLLLVLLLACTTPPALKAESGIPFTLLYSNNVSGEIIPCGG